jgi:NADH-quinone oxidoreductase subunit E
MDTETCEMAEMDGVLDASPDKKEALGAYIDEQLATCVAGRERALLIQSLHRAQELYGYLPESIQLFVANKLGIHLTDVYGVISFYSYFTDKPVGLFKINVCTGTACFVKGADKILEEFSRILGIQAGETTSDRRFSLGSLRCVGACSLAPVVMVNEQVYGNVTPQMVPEILEKCE